MTLILKGGQMTTNKTNVQKTLLMRMDTWERIVEIRKATGRNTPDVMAEAVYDLDIKLRSQDL